MVEARTLRLLPLLSLILLCHRPLRAQQEPPPPPAAPGSTLSVEVRLVSVDAVVRDRDGNPVLDLGQDAFSLRADGKPVSIRYFNRDNDLPLTVGLMIDTSGSQTDFLADEGLASDIFLRNTLTNPQDRAFIVRFSSDVLLLQKMTSHLSELHQALRVLDYQRDPLAGTGRGGTLLYDAIDLAVSKVMGQEQGRRALVILTDGGDNGSRTDLKGAIRQAQLANVAVYGVLYTAEDAHYPQVAIGRPSGIEVMREISHATGGRDFVVGAGMPIAKIFEAIATDLRSQYRFGFTPTPSKPGKFHSLDLKPVDKSLIVQARTGYYTP